MFSIPKEEYENKSYLNDLETYPVYFVCFESGHIKKIQIILENLLKKFMMVM